jgi:hypothetical protein
MKNLIITIVFALSSFKISAQNTTIFQLDINDIKNDKVKVSYNNKKPVEVSLDKLKSVKNGNKVYVQLKGFNKELYELSVNGTKSSYNTEIPDILTGISLPSTLSFDKNSNWIQNHSVTESYTNAQKDKGADSLQNLQKVAPVIGKEKNCEEQIAECKDNIKISYEDFTSNIKNINRYISFYNYLDVLQKKCDLSYTHIQTQLKDSLSSVFGVDNSDSLIDNAIREKFNNCYKLLDESHNNIFNKLNQIDSIIYYGKCNEVELKKIKNFSEREMEIIMALNEIFEKVKDFKSSHQAELIIIKYKTFKVENYTYTSDIIEIKNVDDIEFNISIKPKNWLPCDGINKNLKLEMNVKGGFKMDFSTGAFINFGKKLIENKYYLDSSNVIQQVKTSSSKIIPSMGALVHMYYRTGHSLNVALSLGASLTTDFSLSNFHAGISFIKSNRDDFSKRLILSGGLTSRYLKDLNTAYKPGDKIDPAIGNDNILSGKFKCGGFVSLTYNFK